MGDPIERFREVKEDRIDLLPITKSPSEIIHSQQKLRLAGMSLSKSKLATRQEVVIIEVINYLTVDDMF